MISNSAFVFVCLGLGCWLFTGCAMTATGSKRGEKQPLALRHGQRREAAIEDFEQRRSAMQYRSALSRWDLGDVKGCEAMLVTLLERNPQDRPARRLLADICLERADPAAAESHLRTLLQQDADDAQAHHSLGLLLEEAGRREEALSHLDRAAALEPENELFALSRRAAAPPSRRSSVPQATPRQRLSDHP
jgi:predicted Zn-dependent protease